MKNIFKLSLLLLFVFSTSYAQLLTTRDASGYTYSYDPQDPINDRISKTF